MNASEQFKNVGTKCGLITLGGRTLSEHDNSDYEDENIVGLLYKPPFKANDFSCPAFSKPSVKSLAGHGVIKEGEVQLAIGKKDNGINITESAPQEQTVKDNLTSADRAYKSNSSDSSKRYPYVKPTVEVKDSVPNKTVEVKENQHPTQGGIQFFHL
ncbi:ankyrin repeat domain-containing protein 26-like isoform X1 [Halichoerus grypus]